jgi:hypothetical protein
MKSVKFFQLVVFLPLFEGEGRMVGISDLVTVSVNAKPTKPVAEFTVLRANKKKLSLH